MKPNFASLQDFMQLGQVVFWSPGRLSLAWAAPPAGPYGGLGRDREPCLCESSYCTLGLHRQQNDPKQSAQPGFIWKYNLG